MIIEKPIAEHLFTGFSIKRWNDLIRPMELNEMDRRSFAMMLAYFLGRLEEEQGRSVDWDTIIYEGTFDLLRKVAISDIKENVHRRIRTEHPSEYRRLNEWVVEQVAPLLQSYNLHDRFTSYLLRDNHGSEVDDPSVQLATHILDAARSYSSYREFQIIKGVNSHDPRVPQIENDLRKRLEPFLDLVGMRQLVLELDLYRLISVTDRLRYQTRWSRTPRVPETAVLGHSLMVAVFVMLLSHACGACPKRRYNNFFGGLFHDLPEAVTRDIVAPTKTATAGLPEIVKSIEDETIAEELYPHMPRRLGDEIRFFTENEFQNRIVRDGKVEVTTFERIRDRFNFDRYCPIDGEMVRVADEFSAFLEAYQSIEFGVSSPVLEEGVDRLRSRYGRTDFVAGIATARMYAQFP